MFGAYVIFVFGAYAIRLEEEKAELEQRLKYLQEKVEKYKKFNYFLKLVQKESHGGFDDNKAVMARHKTLTSHLVVSRGPLCGVIHGHRNKSRKVNI